MADTDYLILSDGDNNYFGPLIDIGGGLYSTTPLDKSTRAMNTIEYEHHEIHSGSHFYVSGTTTLDSASSDFIDFGVVTPNTTTWAHMTFEIDGYGLTTFTIYEGATYASSDGTAVTPLNNNRNSATASTMVLVTNPGYTAASSDIIFIQTFGVAGGTSQVRGGNIEREHEIILKQNTQYIFRIASGSAGNLISYVGEWYEHADKA